MHISFVPVAGAWRRALFWLAACGWPMALFLWGLLWLSVGAVGMWLMIFASVANNDAGGPIGYC